MVGWLLVAICSRLMTVTGAGVVRSLRRTREPVTTISSCADFLPVSGPGVASGEVVAEGGAATGAA